MAEEVEESYRNPLGVTSDEEGESQVRVCVIFPGLKKKTFSSEAKNAVVEFKPESRGFELLVAMETKDGSKKKTEKYRYHIKKLPDNVVPEKCTYKVKDNQVVIMLQKEKVRSWQRDLSDVGLETFNEDEKEED